VNRAEEMCPLDAADPSKPVEALRAGRIDRVKAALVAMDEGASE